jgi:hypothetical protein
MAMNSPTNGGSISYTVTGTSGGGVSAHSDLSGLTVDDHPQYLNTVRADVRYQPIDPVLTNTTASFTTADETKLDVLVNTPPMTGATSTLPGIAGYVPAPAAGDDVKFLSGAGIWQTVVGGSGGVSDHGALTGLADDDHSQYHNDVRGDARYSQLGHNHTGTYQPLDPVLTATTASFTTADETKLDGLSNAVPMVGATNLAAGTAGLVPAPLSAERENFLRGDGTWQAVASGSASTFDVHRFSGDGVTTAFALGTAPGSENNTQVYINGVYQQKDTYAVSTTNLAFSTAPITGTNNIEVIVIETVPVAVLSGGVSDHASLTGLTLDDHPHYLNNARGDVRYQPLNSVLTATTASFTTADEAAIDGLVTTYQPLSTVLTNTTASFTTADETKLDALAVMVGATAGTAGVTGTVPAALAGEQDKFLRADGTWTTVAPGNPVAVYSITRKLNATGQQSFASTTPAAINLSASTTNLNVGGFSPSLATGSVTVSTTGNYQISFTAYIDDNAGTASGLNIFLAVNGTDVVQSSGTADTAFSMNSSIDTVRSLVAGDVLSLKAASTDGETLNVQGFDFSVVQLASAISPIVNTVVEYGSVTLAANEDANVSATLWVDRTLSIDLPSAGTYRLFWSASGELADAGTVEVALSGRLRNATTGVAYTQSAAIIVGYDSPTASVSTRIGNGAGSAIVAVTGPDTIVLQTRISTLSSSVTVIMGDSYARGTTYLSYEKVAGQLPADVFVGATAGLSGGSGFVPAPAAGDQAKVLTGAGTWVAQPTVITDHGTLTGLVDDDHPQYLNTTRGDARYPLIAHTHSTLVGATSGVAGTAGIVPAPAIVDRNKFLGGGGTWQSGVQVNNGSGPGDLYKVACARFSGASFEFFQDQYYRFDMSANIIRAAAVGIARPTGVYGFGSGSTTATLPAAADADFAGLGGYASIAIGTFTNLTSVGISNDYDDILVLWLETSSTPVKYRLTVMGGSEVGVIVERWDMSTITTGTKITFTS